MESSQGGNEMKKRRTFTAEFKAQTVLGLISGTMSLAQVCQKYGLKQPVVTRWKSEFLERAPQVFSGDPQREADQEQIAEVERMVGRLTMEIEILKKTWPLLTSAPSRNGR